MKRQNAMNKDKQSSTNAQLESMAFTNEAITPESTSNLNDLTTTRPVLRKEPRSSEGFTNQAPIDGRSVIEI